MVIVYYMCCSSRGPQGVLTATHSMPVSGASSTATPSHGSYVGPDSIIRSPMFRLQSIMQGRRLPYAQVVGTDESDIEMSYASPHIPSLNDDSENDLIVPAEASLIPTAPAVEMIAIAPLVQDNITPLLQQHQQQGDGDGGGGEEGEGGEVEMRSNFESHAESEDVN